MCMWVHNTIYLYRYNVFVLIIPAVYLNFRDYDENLSGQFMIDDTISARVSFVPPFALPPIPSYATVPIVRVTHPPYYSTFMLDF